MESGHSMAQTESRGTWKDRVHAARATSSFLLLLTVGSPVHSPHFSTHIAHVSLEQAGFERAPGAAPPWPTRN